ncbi:MAG: hypothetical protein J6U20_00060 [Fibrobacter sp.]|nr:hypothetical protein [Fibrobacter sp.]
MEGLLILIGIWVLDIVIKRVAANRRKQQQQPPQYQPSDSDSDDYESQEQAQEHRSPRSLQDLIRQFEEAQRQASQGNIEPPTPPVEPKRRHAGQQITLRDVAEAVIEVDTVDIYFLMDTFEVDENVAAQMIAALQKHRIIGREMDGECDVLIHDMDELENLLNREKRDAEERTREENEAKLQAERERMEARHAEQQRELERQRELNALEDRAKSAREAAGTNLAALAATETTSEMQPRRAPAVSTKNIADVRKGFIWAKVLDEPRFKRRWSSQYR